MVRACYFFLGRWWAGVVSCGVTHISWRKRALPRRVPGVHPLDFPASGKLESTISFTGH